MNHRTDHLATLVDALGGVTLTEHERAALDTVATLDADTVDGVARLLSRIAEQGRLLDELAATTGRVQAHADATRAYAEKVLAEAEQGPVPAGQLAQLEANLTNQRDRAIERRDMFGHPRDAGEVDGFRASLAALHIWSDGRYGQDLGEQPGAEGGEVL